MIRSTHPVLHLFRAVIGEHSVRVRLPAGGVLLKEFPIDNIRVIIQQHVGNRVQKTDIPI